MTEPGDLLGGRYRILSRIGRGGAGTVFRALDERLDVERAVKVLNLDVRSDPRAMARFEREARALVRLDHPNLVRVVDAEPSGDGGYIVMELVDGVDLAGHIREQGPMTADRAVKTLLEVLDALSAAHAAGLVHRDIKPHNILMGTDGRARLTDFGVAHITGQTGMLTTAGTGIGTWEFSAPEQFADARSADARADLFGAAMVLYVLLTGRAMLEAWHLSASAPAYVGLPTGLVDVIVRGTRLNPAQRYSSAAEMKAALLAARDQPGALPLVPAPAPPRGSLPQSLTMGDFFTRRAKELPPGQRDRLRLLRLGVAGGVAALVLLLIPSGDKAEMPVRIDSRPPAAVTVDGIQRGNTPWEGKLAVGPHTVVYTSPNGTDEPARIEVPERGEGSLCWDLQLRRACLD